MADFYSVLGLTKSATKDDIKKAYRKAALRTHPDRVPPEQKKSAEEAFRQVNAAYEILHDDKNRKLYDTYGTWPPPEEPTTTRSSRSQRKTQDQQRSYSSQPYYEQPSIPTFVFTDPFQLFNQMFAEFNLQMNQFHQAAAAATHSRHNSAPVYPDPFGSFGGPYPGYPPPSAYPSFGAHPYVATTAPGASTTIRTESTFQTSDGGWIKESKVTKVIPSGQRETTIKKTDYNGVVYITRIAGDGTERHFTLYNGVEAPSPHPIPRVAPPPGSAPPPPHRPSSSKKPSPSSSTTKSSEPPITPTRSHSDSYHHPRPTRAENPVPLMASTHRTTSPAPLSAPAGTQGAHGFPFDQVPATKRPSSPQPIARVTSPDPTSLRRQATLPSSYQAAPAPMPRPQSPHFYRPRVASEAVKAPSSKLKTSYSMPPTTTDYASAPEMQVRSSSRAQYATAQDPRREQVPQSAPGSRSASHSRKSSRSNLANEYQKSSHAYQAAPPAEQAAYTTTRSSSRPPTRERTMDAVFDAAPAPPVPQKKHSPHHSVDVKHASSQDKYASVPRAALGANELGLGVSQTQNIPSYVTPTRSRSNTHDKRAAEAPPASMLFGTPAAPSSSTKHSSSKHHHHHHHTASSSAAMYVSSNPLPHPPSMVNLTSQWTHATDSKRRHQQAV